MPNCSLNKVNSFPRFKELATSISMSMLMWKSFKTWWRKNWKCTIFWVKKSSILRNVWASSNRSDTTLRTPSTFEYWLGLTSIFWSIYEVWLFNKDDYHHLINYIFFRIFRVSFFLNNLYNTDERGQGKESGQAAAHKGKNEYNERRIHKQKLETVENQSAEKFSINRYLENQ